MPCAFLYGNLGLGFDGRFPTSLPRGFADDTTLWQPQWNYQRRNLRACADRRGWIAQWPRGGLLSATPVNPMSILGQCIESGGRGNAFEQDSAWGPGTQSTKFLLGTCLDSASAIVAGAVVKPFITATDVEDGPGEVSAADGTFRAGVYTGTGDHYMVAYKVGSPDVAGTTINTLTPTNIDGT